jgi:subtilisin family serine protease
MKKLITSFFILSLCLAEPVLANVKPNDPYYSNEWYLGKIKADSAWDKISASPDIVIAVIDGRIDTNHPDLRNNIWTNPKEVADNGSDDDRNGFIDDVHGWDFVTNASTTPAAFDTGWTEAGVDHGTMVAGIIAAQGNNNEGVTGVTWSAQIMPLRVLNDKGEGKVRDVIRAIDYAVNNGADIINLSFVSFSYNQGLQDAIARAHQAGVIIVAAAGNEQAGGEGYDIDQTPIYPACYDGPLGENMVIGVAATDALDQKAKFSSYGHNCVDLAAPGLSFFNTVTPGSDPDNSGKIYDGYWSGTSMAAPLVTGAIALIEEADPVLSPREVINILFASADNIDRLNPDYIGELGNGRLNLNRAVEMAGQELYKTTGNLLVIPATGQKDPKITATDGLVISKLPSTVVAGSSLASGDLFGNNSSEIVVGAPAGAAPQVKIFNANGKLLKQFLAFDKKFRGGVNLAVGDINGDGQAEIIAVPASGGSGEVRIFRADGTLKTKFAVDKKSWRGGLNVAAGDLDGKGNSEIVIGYGPGSAAQLKIFTSAGRLLGSFFPYEKTWSGGVRVAVANLDGRQDHDKAEIIVAPQSDRVAQIKIFDNHAILKKQFLAYGQNWRNGVNLAAGDINNDGLSEIVLGAQPGAAPHVRVFTGQGVLSDSFYAWSADWSGGVNVGIIQMNN